MKINYKVLWIEDHFNQIKPVIENLESKLHKYGFKFDVEKRTTLSDDDLIELGDKLSKYNPYDMIFFDYDLGESPTGDKIAGKLRRSIFTDMIFYSGKPNVELRKVLFESQIEGVFVVNRTNIIDDAWPIIEDQIKRICDINNMRGVILDEMSKIDLKMRELCKQKYDNLSEPEKEKQVDKILKKLAEKNQTIKTQIDNSNIETLPEMINKPTELEFNIVRTRLKSITKNEMFAENSELKSKQDLRNKFAHNMAKYDDAKGTVSLSGFDETYGFDEFTKIRRELIDLLQQIENV